jgi:predicted RND superfamily exporter protein
MTQIVDAAQSEEQRQPGTESDVAHGRFTELVIRRRGIVVVVTLLLMAAAGLAATRVRLNADFVTYLNAKDPLVRAYNYVGEVFGGNETGMVLVTASDIYQPEVLSLIDELTETYQTVEGIEYATGLTNTLEFTATEWGVEVGRLVRRDALPATAAEVAALRRRVEANPRLSGNLVSKDGTLAAIQLRFASGGEERQATNFATAQRVGRATEELLAARGAPADVAVYFGGLPFLMYNMTMLIAGNMATLIPLMVGFLVLVLYLGLRRWTGVVYPLTVVLVSSVLVLGVMGVFGLRMDLLSGLAPVVLIAKQLPRDPGPAHPDYDHDDGRLRQSGDLGLRGHPPVRSANCAGTLFRSDRHPHAPAGTGGVWGRCTAASHQGGGDRSDGPTRARRGAWPGGRARRGA